MLSLKTKQAALQFKRYFSLDGRNKLSNKFIPVTKDKTSDNSASHGMLLKAGFVRQSGAGIYSLLPLGLRTVDKIERIIDQEMKAIGSEKLSLPLLLNPEGWKKTGRWDGSKGEFFRLKDRKESDLLLAPTHEEEITQLVASELRSAKQLPIRLYQIGRKFRDELRPRAGLLRGREFIMKDLYSFDSSVEDAYKAYDDVAHAYKNIFDRIGVPFVVAEADSGNIGGSKSHEYHLISTVGEDTLLTCSECGYTANEELAIGKLPNTSSSNEPAAETRSDIVTKSLLDRLNLTTPIESTVVSYSGLNNAEDGLTQGLAAIFTPTGRSVNLLKVQTQLSKYLKKEQLLSDKANMDMDTLPRAKIDSMQPNDIPHLHLFLDNALDLTVATSDRVTVHTPDHFRLAREGDHCATCKDHDSILSSVKAIECAHTFYLGTKYSSALDCTFREGNKPKMIPAEMGCYGIGVTRVLAAVAEAKYDEKGIAWPSSLAPYSICIVPTDDRKQEFKDIANQLYDELSVKFNDDVVIDDRRSGFGAKMKDAELIGYPFTIVVGSKSVEEGQVELNERIQGQDSKKTIVSIKDLNVFL
ncbi:hypothetical protein INT47_011842 [Mucor saturninus]|uniref:proline--tRNA ligase n=1 Tax=Mucor saturninus TaxID=64648 RepID=A0A8H7RB58_9FUNG|nr:hypothetical protein INT47_011842 [Mucor saturninus]